MVLRVTVREGCIEGKVGAVGGIHDADLPVFLVRAHPMEEAVKPPQEHDGTTSRSEGILQVVYEGSWAFRADGVLEGEAALRNGRCRSCQTTATARALSPSHRRCRPAALPRECQSNPPRKSFRTSDSSGCRCARRCIPHRSKGRSWFSWSWDGY